MNQIPDYIKIMKQKERTFLSEHESKNLLSSHGISITKEVLVSGKDEIEDAIGLFGSSNPMVLKLDSPDIQHKTEAGLVRLNVTGLKKAMEVYDELHDNARRYNSKARINGILIQEMVTGAVAECIIGMSHDKQFGPVILFGLGGIMVEVFEDVALRIPPFDESQAVDMIQEIKGSKLLNGFRGNQPADISALTDVLVKMSDLAIDLGDDISEIDINPLLVFAEGKGVKAVDALVRLS